MAENQLRLLILRLAQALENDEDLDIERALKTIEHAKSTLETTFSSYQRACPPEARAAQQRMIDSVALFHAALTNLEDYIDRCEEHLLSQARTDADKAALLLEEALDWVESIADRNNPQQLY